MSDISIRLITRENAGDINLKNEPFRLWGHLLPCYQEGQWSYTVSQDDSAGWDLFPDENYDYDQMEAEYLFLGAYDGPVCVGLAILQKQWHKYLYLYDLKVAAAYRRQHIASRLMDAACNEAVRLKYRGLWVVAQDNNLSACLLYLNSGFRIGGQDTEVYTGTKQAGKADIHFYRDAE